jgi:hypothetical protein
LSFTCASAPEDIPTAAIAAASMILRILFPSRIAFFSQA